jgi:hypothetical protein
LDLISNGFSLDATSLVFCLIGLLTIDSSDWLLFPIDSSNWLLLLVDSSDWLLLSLIDFFLLYVGFV